MLTADLLAYDRATVRRYDHDGRLHVEMANISKSNICPYYGREIPGAKALGLQPDVVYQLFRDPGELKKGADTSNNIQLMQVHDPVTPDQPKQMKVVGSTGTDAVFEAPYLKNSLAVWTQSAIDLIESNKKKQLSCGYHYRADMTSGTYEGARYDGVMRDIRFNHVALVEEGRAGDDVVIGDSMPPGIKGTQNMKTSRKALVARGALATYLRPKLAQDAKIDLRAALLGTTAVNWPTAKPTIIARVKAMTAGKLAQDASLEDMHGLLDSLDREGEDEMDDEAEDEESDEDKAKREAKEKADKAAADEESETEEERAARMKKRADDKAAKDAEMPEALKAAAEKEAKDKAARDAEPKPVTKAAMDAAIAAAVAATQITQQEIREAERDVFPWIGAVLPQKTPGDVYRLALDSMPAKPNLTGVHPSAFKAILAAYGDPARRAAPRIAMDAAGVSDFDKRFPDVSRIIAA